MAKRTIEVRTVENPMLTQGLREEGQQRAETIEAAHNMDLMIGAFSRVQGRTELQTVAAARFRNLWDSSQIGGSKAIDYGLVRVDTSGPSEAQVFVKGEDARRAYSAAVQAIGLRLSRLVELVVCEERSVREVARMLEGGDGGSAQGRVKRNLLRAAALLAIHFGLRKVAGGRGRVVSDGARPTDTSTQIVIERKACAA